MASAATPAISMTFVIAGLLLVVANGRKDIVVPQPVE
jgi:hypothetical protein